MTLMIRALLLILLLICESIYALTIEDLQSDGHLSISYRVLSDGEIVQYQPVTLEIEVATDRWFSRGSRIESFEIDKAIVYRSSELSTNSSRSDAGRTWAVQLWTLVFYPQKPGPLRIPAIHVFVSVNTEGGVVVEGSVRLDPQLIDVVTPSPMVGVSDWLATTSLVVEEDYQGLKESYQPGDAITRTISMQVQDSPAMMLPAVIVPDLDGVAVYRVQPKVYEENNRGNLVGYRQQQFIYTVERAGSYTLPSYTFYWWDLERGVKEIIELPALTFSTAAATANEKIMTDLNLAGRGWSLLIVGLLILLGLALIALLSIRFKLKGWIQKYQQKKQRQRDFIAAVQAREPEQALQCLYILLEDQFVFKGVVTLDLAYQADASCQNLLQKLKNNAYGAGEQTPLTLSEAKQLLSYLVRRPEKNWPWQQPVKFSLNT